MDECGPMPGSAGGFSMNRLDQLSYIFEPSDLGSRKFDAEGLLNSKYEPNVAYAVPVVDVVGDHAGVNGQIRIVEDFTHDFSKFRIYLVVIHGWPLDGTEVSVVSGTVATG